MNDDMMSPQLLSIEPRRRDRITAISSAVPRRPIVLVLGMHRSGTSLCSHILSALGVDMADKISGPGNMSAPDASNPRGHWERWEIVQFHDRLLGLFNRDYLGRLHDFALPVAWWADPRVAQIRREIVAFLQQRMGEAYFGFKDPRVVRLMPVWHQIFNELRLAPKLVLCLRNPAQVARSLHSRDGLDPVNGEYRWLVHMIDFYRYTSNSDYCAVEYEEWFNNPAANIEKLRKFLDLPWQQSESDLALLLSDLVDPTARHDDPGHREAGQPLVRTLYRLAGQAGQDTAARDQIAYIVSQFVSFQQLQKPLLQAFEDVAKTAAKYPVIEQEAAALRALVGERDAAVAAAGSRANAAETRLVDALAEIEGQRAHLRRADELAEGLQAAQKELAAHEAAVQRAEQEVRESRAEVKVMQGEIAKSQIALARAERAAQERAGVAAMLEAELGALRENLARAEREAQERAAGAAAFQAEILALRDTLTAARQVGKAAVDAFRLDTAAPPKGNEPGGWWRAVMRFLASRRVPESRQ